MKFHYFKSSKSFAGVPGWFCAALLLALSSSVAFAQRNQAERWLFVFDTSSQMKKDLPATTIALEQMLGTSADGQLHAGDSVGIWTYDQQLHAGQVPLFEWKPGRADIITSNLVAYLKRQRYRDDSSLAAVQSFLPQVVTHSTRLTTVIFCDGNSLLRGTPYDDGVNQSFHDSLAERNKSHQPFVVVLRSQLGKYVNCTVAYPPGSINLPPFPKLPPPPATNNPTVANARTAAPAVPPLVIVGTKVSTNLNATAEMAEPEKSIHAGATNVAAAPVSQPSKPTTTATTNSPGVEPVPTSESTATATNLEVKTEVVKTAPVLASTNAALTPPTNTMVTGASAVTAPSNATETANVETMTAQTNVPATTQPTSGQPIPGDNANEMDSQSRILIWVGATLIVAAAILVILLIVRPGRRPRGSLISSSMQDDIRRK